MHIYRLLYTPHTLYQVGLHTCFHAWAAEPAPHNTTMIRQHGRDLKKMMQGIRTAIDRTPAHVPRTRIIIQTSGRIGNSDARADECIWRFNRIAAYEAHIQGFTVLEREELERRLQYKSEHTGTLLHSYTHTLIHSYIRTMASSSSSYRMTCRSSQ